MESILEMEMTILGAATLQHGNGFCSKQQGKATVCYYLNTKSGKQHSCLRAYFVKDVCTIFPYFMFTLLKGDCSYKS